MYLLSLKYNHYSQITKGYEWLIEYQENNQKKIKPLVFCFGGVIVYHKSVVKERFKKSILDFLKNQKDGLVICL
ncbi:MAG: hypothetical protein ACOC1K_02175 [Nanoarchaeota archaeon]